MSELGYAVGGRSEDGRCPISRRAFAELIAMAGTGGLMGACSFPKLEFADVEDSADAGALPEQRTRPFADDFEHWNQNTGFGFWVDTASCVGCCSCVEACEKQNDLPGDTSERRRVVRYRFESGDVRFVSLSCMHCAKPTCAQVCPAAAIVKRADGIVTVDQSRCLGCKYCKQACPFGAPNYSDEGMDKCDYCLGANIDPEGVPFCVQACPTGALKSGRLHVLKRKATTARKSAWQVEAPSGPSLLLS